MRLTTANYAALIAAFLTGCMAFTVTSCEESKPDNPDNTIVVESVTIEDGTLTGFELLTDETRTLHATVAPKDYESPKVEWKSDPQGIVELSPSSNTLECTVKGVAEGETTITASCGGKNASITVNVSEVPLPKGEKAAYEDFLGHWYVSGTLGEYSQKENNKQAYDIKYCINVAKDADGTGYKITEWETPATLADAKNSYYSCLHKDKDGNYLDDIFSYLKSSMYLDMTIDAGYNAEEGYMYMKFKEYYNKYDHAIVLGLNVGVPGDHLASFEKDGEIAHCWKQADGSVKVVSADGRTAPLTMGYIDLSPSLSYLIVNKIFNGQPDFPLTMTKAEGVVEALDITRLSTYSTQIAVLNEGEEFDIEATLSPETADASHLEWYSEDESVATVDAKGHVKAVRTGDTYIYAYADGAWAKGAVTVKKGIVYKAPAESEAVDLGLSVKWAPYNLGGSAPEDYGGYYAWGETEAKDYFSAENYKYAEVGLFDKYGNPSEYGPYTYKYTKYLDSKNQLADSDDAAHVKWGGNWRMPTQSQMEELRDKCTCKKETLNGVVGVRVTGPNGNSIFLPYAGKYFGDEVQYAGESVYVWNNEGHGGNGANPDPTFYYGHHYNYSSLSADPVAYVTFNSRLDGMSIRPVLK